MCQPQPRRPRERCEQSGELRYHVGVNLPDTAQALDAWIIPPLQQFAVPVESLTPDPRNARKHSRKNLDAIKASLSTHRQYQPLVVQRDGMVVRAGNGRLQAAKELGWTHIAVMIVDTASEAAAISLAIADNWTSDTAEWDIDILLEEVERLRGTEFDIVSFDEADFAHFTEEAEKLSAVMNAELGPGAGMGGGGINFGNDGAGSGPIGHSDASHDASAPAITAPGALRFELVFNSPEEYERFGELLKMLRSRYPNHENTAARLDAWVQESEGM